MIHSIPGMGNAVISRYAYAIEYDFLPPEQLERSLKNKKWDNLFTAGQINGTSGYEEAAGQGLVAGANAARCAAGKSLFELGRDSSYIGVMIDDLCTKEIVEPYRLFTSRAEYRLHLRQDNADLRLCETAHSLGLLPENKYQEFSAYKEQLDSMLEYCRTEKYKGKQLLTLLKDVDADTPWTGADAVPLPFPAGRFAELPVDRCGCRVWSELLIEAKYDGYLQRETAEISRLHKLEDVVIPENIDYETISGLSNESRMKLIKVRPSTLGQAGRIDGVTPADIALLQVNILRMREDKAE